MNLPQTRRAFHLRWILGFGWFMVISIYLNWLFQRTWIENTLLPARYFYLLSSRYINDAFQGLTNLDWLDSGNMGLREFLSFDIRGHQLVRTFTSVWRSSWC